MTRGGSSPHGQGEAQLGQFVGLRPPKDAKTLDVLYASMGAYYEQRSMRGNAADRQKAPTTKTRGYQALILHKKILGCLGRATH